MNCEGIYQIFRPDLEGPVTKEDFRQASEFYHAFPTPWLEPEDVAELVLFLASDASKIRDRHERPDRRRLHDQVAQRPGPVNLPRVAEAWSSMARRPTARILG